MPVHEYIPHCSPAATGECACPVNAEDERIRRREGWQGRKGKEEYLYSAIYTRHSLKALRHRSHSFTCKLHHACLSFISVHQIAPPLTEVADIQLQLLIYRPLRDERLSWPGWLTFSGRFTHISGHPLATGLAQDRESSPAKDRRSTAVPRNQPTRRQCGLLPNYFGHLLNIHTQLYFTTNVVAEKTYIIKYKLNEWSLN